MQKQNTKKKENKIQARKKKGLQAPICVSFPLYFNCFLHFKWRVLRAIGANPKLELVLDSQEHTEGTLPVDLPAPSGIFAQQNGSRPVWREIQGSQRELRTQSFFRKSFVRPNWRQTGIIHWDNVLLCWEYFPGAPSKFISAFGFHLIFLGCRIKI